MTCSLETGMVSAPGEVAGNALDPPPKSRGHRRRHPLTPPGSSAGCRVTPLAGLADLGVPLMTRRG
ncbi:MAG: hypothetical protein H7A53_11970 [Akkermansiaceae bacterium]|nr:hypothetical protein [Akkermansiaceae bacterium]